jgi:hypothetical protein
VRQNRPPSLYRIVLEHNRLNGFGLVLVEFAVVGAAGALIGYSGFVHRSFPLALEGVGVGVNAIAVCATVVVQMRRGEKSGSLADLFQRQTREKIRSAHPDLETHTVRISVAVLIPFFLAAFILLGSRNQGADGDRRSAR